MNTESDSFYICLKYYLDSWTAHNLANFVQLGDGSAKAGNM
jgi:hypothetical protein